MVTAREISHCLMCHLYSHLCTFAVGFTDELLKS